ncbi:hypothetical protein EON65_07660 [archaeon]|nr:MAG: hypothetical protein EON65_07660 [archaeon]
MADSEEKKPGVFEDISRKYQYLLDKSSPHVLYRWIGFLVAFAGYLTRVYLVNGWYIVTYGLGIFLLNQLIGFLSPQVIFEHFSFHSLPCFNPMLVPACLSVRS